LKKVLSEEEAILQCREWKRNGRRVVCVSGAFALLHPGHIRLLEQARSYGDVLIVVLESSSAANAATLRLVSPAVERIEILSALAAVDFVTNFSGSSLSTFLDDLHPDVVVSGAEPRSGLHPAQSAGHKTAVGMEAGKGPKIILLPLEPGYSTKLLLDRIAQLPS